MILENIKCLFKLQFSMLLKIHRISFLLLFVQHFHVSTFDLVGLKAEMRLQNTFPNKISTRQQKKKTERREHEHESCINKIIVF